MERERFQKEGSSVCTLKGLFAELLWGEQGKCGVWCSSLLHIHQEHRSCSLFKAPDPIYESYFHPLGPSAAVGRKPAGARGGF